MENQHLFFLVLVLFILTNCKDSNPSNSITETTDIIAAVDSLFTENRNTQKKHFLHFTSLLGTTDGESSELIGLEAFRFVEEEPTKFVLYLSELIEEELENWAQIVCSEILISHENEEEIYIHQLEKDLINASRFIKSYKKGALDSFISLMRQNSNN